jgi:hypothetical protein
MKPTKVTMQPIPKATQLRNKFLDRMDSLRAEIKVLDGKLALLDEIEKEAGELQDSLPLSGGESHKYAKMGLSEASLDSALILANRPGKNGVTRLDVAKFMVTNGFEPVGKHFNASVDIALRRWTKRGKLFSDIRDGSRVYMPMSPELL